jgi:integrase/recombinase XerD
MSASPPEHSLGRRRSPAAVPGYLTGRRPRSRGRRYPPWNASAARAALRRRAASAGVRRRFAPYQLRHAHALELLREGVPLNVIQRQLGHRNLGVTSIYLQGIDPEEIIETVHARPAPMIPASMELALPPGR